MEFGVCVVGSSYVIYFSLNGVNMKRAHRNTEKARIRANSDAIFTIIKTMETNEEKRRLIAKKNPLLYVFGHEITPIKDWLDYEDNENHNRLHIFRRMI